MPIGRPLPSGLIRHLGFGGRGIVIMHEASAMKGLMEKIEALAQKEGAARVTQVSVWLGALNPVSAEHIREDFVKCSKARVSEGASLVINVSTDVRDPNARELLLRGVEVEI